MNLLEIIQEYLRQKKAGHAADSWLSAMESDNEWPGGMATHIRGCWVDLDTLALKEAKRVLELYEINPEKFKLAIIESIDPKDGEVNDAVRKVEAVHTDNDYSWIAYEVYLVLASDGSADDECTRLSIRPIDG